MGAAGDGVRGWGASRMQCMMTAGLFGVGPSRVSRSGGNRFTPGLKEEFLPPEVSARLPGLFWTPRAPCSDLSLVLFQKIPPLRELTDGV